jgi:Flp pilus assembly pilin Flp
MKNEKKELGESFTPEPFEDEDGATNMELAIVLGTGAVVITLGILGFLLGYWIMG